MWYKVLKEKITTGDGYKLKNSWSLQFWNNNPTQFYTNISKDKCVKE